MIFKKGYCLRCKGKWTTNKRRPQTITSATHLYVYGGMFIALCFHCWYHTNRFEHLQYYSKLYRLREKEIRQFWETSKAANSPYINIPLLITWEAVHNAVLTGDTWTYNHYGNINLSYKENVDRILRQEKIQVSPATQSLEG